MSEETYVFLGVLVSSKSLKNLDITNGYLVVENGVITKRGTVEEFHNQKACGNFENYEVLELSDDQFLMPGFVDCHTHAPQYPNIGLGLDKPLLEWLEKYTFPLETKYSDVEFAAKVYDKVVQTLMHNGTTTACYFGSLHLEGTLKLAETAILYGQRALVGKVSMNLENDVGYYNSTESELKDVEKFIQHVLSYKNDLVQPIITPRFALSCDGKLMSGLAELSKIYDCRVQSHISENLKEIEYVLKIHKSCKSYGETYDKCNILHDKCIMAHAIHLTDEEIHLLNKRGVSIAHCPASNTRLKSGLCPVRKYINSGITVGLGTDVSGGDSASILDALRRTMDVSMHLELMGREDHSLSWVEAFYLATLGGAKALNLEDRVGSLEVGKDFDALVIDVYSKTGPIDNYGVVRHGRDEAMIDLVQKFAYLGNDRNIAQVYVKGRKVKDLFNL